LQGPKLRVGTFEEDGAMLTDGQTFVFDLKDDLGDSYRVKLPHPEILNTLQIDDILLLDDGKLKMKVKSTTMATAPDGTGAVTCEVINGGKLSNRKGVNTPSIVLPISPLTPKDRVDLEFMLTLEIDWIALSFVQVCGLSIFKYLGDHFITTRTVCNNMKSLCIVVAVQPPHYFFPIVTSQTLLN
jgi:pyruvate kinase